MGMGKYKMLNAGNLQYSPIPAINSRIRSTTSSKPTHFGTCVFLLNLWKALENTNRDISGHMTERYWFIKLHVALLDSD